MRTTRPTMLGLLAGVILLGVGTPAHAARLLTATVELDGRIVLQTYYTDTGIGTPAHVWRYLGKEPGHTSIVNLPIDPADPLRATLRGDLIVRVRHVESRIVEVKSSELSLIRADALSDRWFLAQDVVEELAQANGIPAPSPQSLAEQPEWHAAIWLGGALLTVGLILYLAWRMRTRQSGS